VKIIDQHFENSKIPVVAEGVLAKWQPKPEDLEGCKKLGRKVAERIKKD